MNARRLAQVGIGLIGVWLVGQALMLFVTFASMGAMPGREFALSAGVPFVLMLAFSYLLVFHNASLARAIAPDPAANIDSGGADIARVLFALLGVLLVSEAIPSMLNSLAAMAMSANQEYSSVTQRAGPIRSLLASAVKGAIGWYLIANPGRLIEIVKRPLGGSGE
jgi:hypothetical protein